MSKPTSTACFNGNFTQQEAIPSDAIDAAIQVMQSGRLHRYNVANAEDLSETAQLEIAFAEYQKQRYCLACASGGYALQIALRALGVMPGDVVLTNAFTLSPVPGAIAAVSAKPVLVETTADLVIDLDHLAALIKKSKARVLLLSHMRGHIADMHALCELLTSQGVALIEDCAHTMGALFDGAMSGSHGVISCFSTQTYKHLNSGEGGLITSDDDLIMAKAIVMSGSYMLYERHAAAPPAAVFEQIKLQTPNCSGRMDNLRAAILLPQLASLDKNAIRWNERYEAFAAELSSNPHIRLPQPHPLATEVSSSIQFFVEHLNDQENLDFLANCLQRGVELKWFGADSPAAYTSRYDSWAYVGDTGPLPQTDNILRRLYDCRLPLTFSIEDCSVIGSIVSDAVPSTDTQQVHQR